jgi:alpha 1,3-glucosidase
MFKFDVWKESTKNLYIWNDMNEPSVFDGPEITMPKDNVHAGGWEHRDLHNINGMMFHNQTQHALTVRDTTVLRPFVLSRAYFAGSQRYGAIWIGDNMGTWDHLAGETAVFLSNSIAGISFVGADVGGFFGNPTEEMLTRWYQAGAFMPFFRAHAHIDTKRREPYLYEEPTRGYLRDALRLRYKMLPVWYNAFHDAATHGYPVIWCVHPVLFSSSFADPSGRTTPSSLRMSPASLSTTNTTSATLVSCSSPSSPRVPLRPASTSLPTSRTTTTSAAGRTLPPPSLAT